MLAGLMCAWNVTFAQCPVSGDYSKYINWTL